LGGRWGERRKGGGREGGLWLSLGRLLRKERSRGHVRSFSSFSRNKKVSFRGPRCGRSFVGPFELGSAVKIEVCFWGLVRSSSRLVWVSSSGSGRVFRGYRKRGCNQCPEMGGDSWGHSGLNPVKVFRGGLLYR